MNGHDFDHNGRVDSRDYYIYSSVCSNDDGSGHTGKSSYSSSGFNSETLMLWLAMIYFFSFIKGTFGFNFFSGLLGIISGGYLFLRLMAWAYSQ